MNNVELTTKNVSGIFHDCLFRVGESHSNMVVASGILFKVGFHPERLQSHKEEIITLCNKLYIRSAKGRKRYTASFMNMCMKEDGDIWTGVQKIMEELLLLGIAVGKMRILQTREEWASMPGGVPFIEIYE